MPRAVAPRARRESYKDWKKLCIIATEDSSTGAYAYFNEMRQHEEKYRFLTKYSFRISELLPSYEGKSAPQHVLDNIKDKIKSLKQEGFEKKSDTFWIVCDVDSWPEKTIEQVIKECQKIGIYYAFSKPCSEIWILYHQKDFDANFDNSQLCKDAATKLIIKRKGYQNLITDMQLKYAVKHAEKADRPKTQQWPKTQGSHIYKLVQYLLD